MRHAILSIGQGSLQGHTFICKSRRGTCSQHALHSRPREQAVVICPSASQCNTGKDAQISA